MAISAPQESLHPHGRPDGAARARTEELYASHARTVSGLCRALLRDRSEAEDATQQVFLSAHRALLNGSDPREPAAWLATIARNECWSRVRARMREPLPTGDAEEAAGLPDPLAEAIRHADLAALWQAIKELPAQQREALLLREFGGLSYDELAAALAVSSPAVESLLFRARSRLRTQLKTAYAAVSGAGWLETLLRLLAGGSAPVATKAVALGLGAAALTGGAVVAPRVFVHPDHATRHVSVRARPAVPTPAAAALVLPVAQAAFSAPRHAHAAAPLVFQASEPSDRGDPGGDHGSGSGDHGSSGGDTVQAEPRDTSSSTEERHSHDGPSGGDSAGQPSGDGGGEPSSDTPTQPQPQTQTQQAPQEAAPPASNPSSDGPTLTVPEPVLSGDGPGGGD